MSKRSRLSVPVVEESIDVDTEFVHTGTVRVRTRTDERQETVEVPLERQEAVIERVPVDRVVEAAEGIRQEGDVTIVPVYEERVVVTRQLVLREELHIRRRVSRENETVSVALRRQDVEVTREAATPSRGTPR